MVLRIDTADQLSRNVTVQSFLVLHVTYFWQKKVEKGMTWMMLRVCEMVVLARRLLGSLLLDLRRTQRQSSCDFAIFRKHIWNIIERYF